MPPAFAWCPEEDEGVPAAQADETLLFGGPLPDVDVLLAQFSAWKASGVGAKTLRNYTNLLRALFVEPSAHGINGCSLETAAEVFLLNRWHSKQSGPGIVDTPPEQAGRRPCASAACFGALWRR